MHLTQLASAAGCGAKIGPKVLAQVVGKLPKFTDPMLLVGPETSDDAAVYKINDELAMIHTVDFFPPVVDNPYMYGQIAAANALSDVYAMGGVPKLALNVVAFPNCLGPEVLEQILRGGADKVMEAGAVLAGGHTINDKEPKYGLCVTGYVYFGKSLDGFTPMGPCIVTADEFDTYPPALPIRSRVNGALRQDSNTKLQIFDIDHVIHELSQGMTLKAGTIIATGTPAGVGMGMDPPQFLHPGDTVQCEIEGIGTLTNTVR